VFLAEKETLSILTIYATAFCQATTQRSLSNVFFTCSLNRQSQQVLSVVCCCLSLSVKISYGKIVFDVTGNYHCLTS